MFSEFHTHGLDSLPLWVFLSVPPAIIIVKLLYTSIYNLYFHPLSNVPGPFEAAISPFYHVRIFVSRHYPKIIAGLHLKYGSVVRVGPNMLSFNTAQSWKDIYGHIPGRATFVKAPVYQSDQVGNIATETDPEKHHAMRKLLAHGFSPKALTEQEDLVHLYIDKFIRQLNVHATGPEGDEMVKWYNFLTFDIIGDLAFGESFGSLDTAKAHFWVTGIVDTLGAMSFGTALSSILGKTKLGWFVGRLFVPRHLEENRLQHKKCTQEKTIKRINNPTKRKDFLSKMIAEKNAQNISLESLESQCSALIVAGSETTATVLAAATYYLCRHPEVHKKLNEEIRSTFSSYDKITNQPTEHLTYLKAVIDETTRIYPPSPVGMPRISPGAVVDGLFIPAGVELFTSQYSVNQQAAHFRHPDEFIPERWLDPDCTDKKDANQPFSLGTRACLGQNLAWMEMRLVICKMLWVYDMELLNDSLDWERDSTCILLWKKPNLRVRFTKRAGIDIP